MPVVHVRSLVPNEGDGAVETALASITRAVSEILGADPSGTWCTFTAIDRMTLGDRVVADEGRIVYLDIWVRSRGDATDRAALVAASRAASAGFGVPIEDVWATLRRVEDGSVFAGGGLIGD